ncbi:hypothetical protein Lgra_0287 [Legionella gratiana]|uniref:Uncharacterized protein n=1 Tax=Legionella gratiana TaxID=45066 RepID=A0A378JC04_9GAMM|nr:hypothetical protein [Legionella gratiana]KTD15621.1 hypothetical protein Lgra_0287 [Legionella gratiana]STX44959.1 Uncharacterised protein [Legionella gratiana]
MFDLSLANTKVIDGFITSYNNLNPVEKYFFPKEIKRLIKQYTAAENKIYGALHLINSIINSSSNYSCINNFKTSSLYKTCQLLKSNQLLSDEAILIILNHTLPQRLFSAVRILDEHDLFKNENERQKNFFAVAQHQTAPDRVCRALIILDNNHLLNNTYRRAVAQHPTDPTSVALALKKMTLLGLLNGVEAETNLEVVAKHPDPASIILGIDMLDASDTEIQDKFNIITHSKAIFAAAVSLQDLRKEKIPLTGIKELLIESEIPGKIITQVIEHQRNVELNPNKFFSIKNSTHENNNLLNFTNVDAKVVL